MLYLTSHPSIAACIAIFVYLLLGVLVLAVTQAINAYRDEVEEAFGCLIVIAWPLVLVTLLMKGLTVLGISLGDYLGDLLDNLKDKDRG